MIRDLKSLYTAVKNNRVVLFETNLKKFHTAFSKIEPSCRKYDYFYRKFKKGKILEYLSEDEEIYFIQKLL